MNPRVLAIAAKDIRILVRDRMALALLLGMPVMLIVVLSFALKSEFEEGALQLNLPVLDYDSTPNSQRLADLLGETDGVTIRDKTGSDEDGLRKQVQNGDYLAALIIPEGFGDNVDAGDNADLTLVLDPGETASEGIVRSVVMSAANSLLSENNRPPDTSPAVTVSLNSEFAGYGDAEPDVYEQNVPGFAILAAFFITMFLAGSILAERALGTFRRLLATPVSRSEILIGKMLAVLAVGFTQMAILFAFGHVVFGLSLGDQPLGLVFITIGVVCAATGLGVLIAGVARTDQQVTGLGTLIVLTMAALGGSMVPRFIMPEAMQTIGLITPHAWAIEGYHEIIVRREGLVDVLPHTAALLGFAAIFFAIGLWRFRFQMAPT